MVVIVKNSVYRKDGINKLKLTLIANYILLHYTNRERRASLYQ